MRRKYIIFPLLVFICFFICLVVIFTNKAFILSNESQEATDISLINLISNSKDFDGKFVRVIGVCEYEFEGYGLYLSINDYDYGISKNAIWLELDENDLLNNNSDLKFMNGKYVIIEGIFEGNDNGHLDLYSGTIKNITRMNVWKSEDERRSIIQNIDNDIEKRSE